MIRRVLVTRPEPDASRTAQQLAMRGFEALVLPLTKIVALPEQDALSTDVDAVAVTSSNALRHASDKLLAALTRKPCFAVGDKTAKQARQAGFASVMSANGDAHRLAALIGDNSTPDARIAYLCGGVRRPEFEAALEQIGRKVVPIETYDTVRLEPTDSAIEQALGAQSVDAVLVYSAESAVVLTNLLKRPSLADRLSNAVFCCLSARVAASLALESTRIRIAARPEQKALFDVLGAGAESPYRNS